MRARLAILALLVPVFARADPEARHVYVAGLTEGDVALVIAGASRDPAFVLANGELIPPPEGGDLREDEALLPALPDAEAASAPATEMRPDRMTGSVSATDYFEAFTPAIAPYKRSIAYDAVRLDPDGTPVLVVANDAARPVAILGTTPPPAGPRDAFWGTAMLDFRRGARVAIPSVSPDARILHARTEPSIDFELEVDSAGAFFAHARERGAGIVRLTFLTDAPRGFFRRPIPSQRLDALAHHAPPVPEAVRERARRFADEIGVTPGMPAEEGLDRLVAHFRAFVEADEIPSPTGDVYLDLARGGVGVCRHRAYAFVVTALSLGLPAHYVQNEAHAWVEVELRDGWLRIDLGGSAQGVNAHGLQDRPKHEIAARDPFPQPEVYVRDYLGRSLAPESEASAGRSNGAPGRGEDGTGSGASGRTTNVASNVPSENASNPADASRSEDDEGAGGELASRDDRTPTRLTLDAERHRVYRGQMLDLAGRLVDARGVPLARARIEFRVESNRLLGVALTDETGRFVASLGIPPDLGVGQHPMQVTYVGDREHLPAAAP